MSERRVEVAPAVDESRGSLLDAPLAAPGWWNWEVGLYVLLVILAALLRFWDLGLRALHHDESLHTVYSWYLFTGRGYRHDPLMHGPFQFHATALAYFLLGVSDYTARVLPALFGTALVGLPYLLRGQLGRAGGLVVAGLLALSPSFLYYSRFARNDIYIAVWSLLLVACLWRYQAERRSLYLYAGAALLSLSFATKEVTYITVFVFGIYLLLRSWREVVPKLRTFDLSQLSPTAEFMVVVGTLSLPQGAALSGVLWRRLGIEVGPSSQMLSQSLPAAGTVAFLLAVSAVIGLRWNPGVWLRCAAAFYGVYVLLFTTLFTNLPGLATGIWGSLDYWLAQHEVQRGSQPWFYYLLLLPLYEFLPLFFGLVSIFSPWPRKDAFARFLIFWLVGAVILYSFAGEKMPWLVLHLALPVLLLGGKYLGALLEHIPWRRVAAQGGLGLLVLLPLALLALRALLALDNPLQPGPQQGERLLQGVVLVGVLTVLLTLVVQTSSRLRLAGSLQMLALTLLLVLGVFSVRAAWQASYYHGDIPVEMLVYTQTSPEVPQVLADIERLARQTGEGKNLRITVDAADGFTWPWAWYLRDYQNVDYPNLDQMSGPPLGVVLLLSDSNKAKAKPYLTKYGPGRPFRLRWWFPERYRDLTLSKVFSGIFHLSNWGAAWRYFAYRELAEPLGYSGAIAYFPQGFGQGATVGAAAPGPEEEVARKTVLVRSERVIGGPGKGPGAFEDPRGLAIDQQGNLFVVDSMNHRIQKLSPEGAFLAQVGQKGSGAGEFMEPWGIAVDVAGDVYVADTWNHRIQKFNADLQFIAQWGTFANAQDNPTASPGKFYGPRGIAIDGQGNLWVTDTGNHRIQRFAPDGTFLGLNGSPGSGKGQFQEPVGIAVSQDGHVFVADTWNRRIQRFDPGFAYLGEFPVMGWEGQSVLNKPYLAVDPRGDLVVTDPESHRLLRFSPQGVLLSAIGRYGTDSSSFNLPTGVVVDAQGRTYVSETGNDRVQRLPLLR